MATTTTAKRKQANLVINKEYFSGAQASIFIGDVWVDDVTAIDYTVQHTRAPFYGYGSQHFDFVPKGSILVSGSFTINFREPNYLWLIAERYKIFNTTKEERIKERKDLEAADLANTYVNDRRQRFDTFFNKVDPNTAKGVLIEQSREFNGITENNKKDPYNHKVFDILIGYGNYLGEHSPGETISSVHIMGKSKVINADGRPIAEQYNFIAKRVF